MVVIVKIATITSTLATTTRTTALSMDKIRHNKNV